MDIVVSNCAALEPLTLREQLSEFKKHHHAVPEALRLPAEVFLGVEELLPEGTTPVDTLACLYVQHYTASATQQMYQAMLKNYGSSDIKLSGSLKDWRLDEGVALLYGPGVYVVNIDFVRYAGESVDQIRSRYTSASICAAAYEAYAAILCQGHGFIEKLSRLVPSRIAIAGLDIDSEGRYKLVPCLEYDDRVVLPTAAWSHHQLATCTVPMVREVTMLKGIE